MIKYASQIQDLVMAKDHITPPLKKYKDKSENGYNTIYRKGSGQARNKLSDTRNITLTKYLNGWLNTGYQKGHFEEAPECPCCGWHKEIHLHMFQCMSPEMKWTRKESLKLPERYYQQHKIPAVVYIPFLKMCKSMCDLEELKWHGPLSPTIRKAGKNQQSLGNEFLLHGYLTIHWLAAIQENHPDKSKLLLSHL